MLSSVDQTIWGSSPAQLGLTEDQWEFEQRWLKNFNESSDALDWEEWKRYWCEDGFFKFCSLPKIEGKVELEKYFVEYFKGYKQLKHNATRHSFDVSKGIIYQSLTVSSIIQGDEEDKVIFTEGITVIHKHLGESQVHGLEVHADISQLMARINEVNSRVAAKND
ncbi:SnoaL-like domain protein [Ceratobasidium sp. AG-Ba]|nr:SnoaL-like domain protein [Ceratobasidium sp. AG-Ba]QRW14034.1 SnoaL-like domain protein [Ceratobasidium sp. AG-Ba]